MGNKKKDKDGLTARNRRYVKARVEGKPLQECKAIAGYAPTIPTSKIEKPGGAVFQAIQNNLLALGMDDEFIANEIKVGLRKCSTAITRFNPKTGETVQDPDLASHDRYLKMLCKLKGYERERTPQVAIQVNQTTNNQLPGLEGLADGETEKLIDAIRAEIGARQSADVFEASVADADPAARDEVVRTGTEPPEAPGGGSES